MSSAAVDTAKSELISLLPDAVAAIAQCLRQPQRHSRVMLAAAKTVLDRCGIPAVSVENKHVATVDFGTATPEMLRAYLSDVVATLDPGSSREIAARFDSAASRLSRLLPASTDAT